MQKFLINHERELSNITEYIILKCKNKPLIMLLYGGLGAGKTAFVRNFSKRFNIENTASPSFNLIHNYKNDKIKILHIDLYRLHDVKYLEELNIFELLEENDYIFIEWPEIIGNYLDNYNTVKIFFEIKDKKRKIKIEC